MAGLGRNFDILHVARHLLDDDLVFQQPFADLLRIGFRLVDLVDRNDHRHAGRLGVADRLDRLRHQPVVGRHHQHNDIGDIGAAHAHFGERFMARRIEEGDEIAPLGLDLIGADMLGDAARLAAHHIGAAQRVEERGLAVIDMAHDRDHRRARLQRTGLIDIGRGIDIDIAFRHALDVVAEFLDQQFGRVLVDDVVARDRHAHLEQRPHQIGALFGHPVGEFLHGDRLGHDDIAHLLFARLLLAGEMGAPLLFTRALERSETAGAGALIFVERLAYGQLARLAAAFTGFVARMGNLLGRLGSFGRSDRGEAARRRNRAALLWCLGSLRLGRLGRLGGRWRDLRRRFRCWRGCDNRLVGWHDLAAVHGVRLVGAKTGLPGPRFQFPAARSLPGIKPCFLCLAQQAGLKFLPGFGGWRGRGAGYRAGSLGDRSRSGHRLRRSGFGRAGLADQLAPLDLDHHLVGAAVAEGLLDLARFDRALQPQRLAAQSRFIFGLAHCFSTPFDLNLSSQPAARQHLPSARSVL